VFHHPLIRAVAYESQLKSDRTELHRRLAVSIQERDPDSSDENAALIAEHLEAAGDLHAAFDWHMRAGGWAANRDIAAAWLSWERACRVADALPGDDADRTAMRIAPRTLLCGSAWRVNANISGHFEALRELCALAGDKPSLAIGMAGLVMEHMQHARIREASRLASEQMALMESIGDPTLIIGAAFAATGIKSEALEMADVLRWSQIVIDWSNGDPAKGNLIVGSPLALALASRGVARWHLGHPGWRDDLDLAVAMSRKTDPISHAYVVNTKYGGAIPLGVLLADHAAVRDIEDALRIAERLADDLALGLARMALGLSLVHRDPADRERGLEVLAQVRDMCLHQRFSLLELPVVDLYAARARARRGDRDAAIPVMREAVDKLFNRGQFGWFVPTNSVLVETLLERGIGGDLAEAQTAIDRLAAAPGDEGLVMREIWLLRLRALLAKAYADEAAYRDYRDRYRAMATSLGFEGHIKWAEAMP
jgi:hypothetical protein